MYLGMGAIKATFLAVEHSLPIWLQFARIFFVTGTGATVSDPGMWYVPPSCGTCRPQITILFF
jgi:hypothetical protein